jgi:hypothetical protein
MGIGWRKDGDRVEEEGEELCRWKHRQGQEGAID